MHFFGCITAGYQIEFLYKGREGSVPHAKNGFRFLEEPRKRFNGSGPLYKL